MFSLLDENAENLRIRGSRIESGHDSERKWSRAVEGAILGALGCRNSAETKVSYHFPLFHISVLLKDVEIEVELVEMMGWDE